MSGRAGFAVEYAHATQSSDLRVRERPCDVDKLMALAWADRRLASAAYRAKVANEAASIRALHELWRIEVERMAQDKRWTVDVPAQLVDGGAWVRARVFVPRVLLIEVARISLDHWLFDVCAVCCGRKYRLLRDVLVDAGAVPEVAAVHSRDAHGREILSDDLCPACNGTGKAPLAAPKKLEPLVKRALDSLNGRYHAAGADAIQRLKGVLDAPPQLSGANP